MRNFLLEIDESKVIDLTTDWMAREYDRMNRLLFNGELGPCVFGIFTTGRGSEGGVLGWFRICGQNIKVRRSLGRMFRYDYDGREIWVNRDNFVDICKPKIELNGNYRWTQKAALSTLVHEMCHYYCNMNGFRPTQHHGYEFRNIAWRVSERSNEFFSVERIAKAEQMDEMELSSRMQVKRDKRKEGKMSRVIVVLVYKTDGEIRLINANNWNLVGEIERDEMRSGTCQKILISQDPRFIEYLFSHRYGKTMLTYRYWPVNGKEFINMLPEWDVKVRWENNSNPNTGWLNKAIEKYEQEPIVKRIPLFKFQTLQGNVFEMRNATIDEIRQGLKEKFPKWSDEAIERCIQRHT